MRFSIFVGLGLLISLLLNSLGWALPAGAFSAIKLCTFGFMFASGLECSFAGLRSRAREICTVSAGAFVLPFIVGLALSDAFVFDNPAGRWVFATALSVSAVPVIIQILSEQNLLREPIGQMVVSSASLCDVAAWICFMFILPSNMQAGWMQSHLSVLLFFAGVALRTWLPLPTLLASFGETLSRWIFAPVFLIGMGLQINLGHDFDLGLILKITLIATVTKLAGVLLAARLARLPHQDSWMMAAALNARGAVEVLLAHLAFESGLINARWLTTIVATAVITSMIAGPWLGHLWRGSRAASERTKAA